MPRVAWPLIALALLMLFNLFFTPHFFQFQIVNGRMTGYLVDVFHNGSSVMLLAIGMTLVIATGGIDLSVGSVMAITGTMAAVLIARPEGLLLSNVDLHGSMLLAIAIGLGVAALCGLWNGMLVTVLDIQPIIATLILMVSGRGVAQLIGDGQNIDIKNPLYLLLAGGSVLGVRFSIVSVGIVAALAIALTRGTALGLFIESVGSNPTTSRYCGINARLVKLTVYTFCGLCAGLAGLITASSITVADPNNAGLFLELDAILAVSIGGTALTGGRFSLIGSLVGAIVIQTLTVTFLAHDIQRAVMLMVKAAVVIVVCLLQSEVFRRKIANVMRRRA